jgi:hypothetical protein
LSPENKKPALDGYPPVEFCGTSINTEGSVLIRIYMASLRL